MENTTAENRFTAIRRGGPAGLREAALSGLATGSALRLAEAAEARSEALQADYDRSEMVNRVLVRGDRTRKRVLAAMLGNTMERNGSYRADRSSRTQMAVAGFIVGMTLASVLAWIVYQNLFL